jgi:hypothetical protein
MVIEAHIFLPCAAHIKLPSNTSPKKSVLTYHSTHSETVSANMFLYRSLNISQINPILCNLETFSFLFEQTCFRAVFRHYDNTLKDFTYINFSYNINKCDITYMFLLNVISKVIYKSNLS